VSRGKPLLTSPRCPRGDQVCWTRAVSVGNWKSLPASSGVSRRGGTGEPKDTLESRTASALFHTQNNTGSERLLVISPTVAEVMANPSLECMFLQ
jgi:hypothetical protein